MGIIMFLGFIALLDLPMPITMGMKIASTAELVRNADMQQDAKYAAAISFFSEPFDTLTIQFPIKSASPVSDIDSPIIITPIVKITVAEENWPNAVLKSLTPLRTMTVHPKTAVVAIGNLSIIKRTIVAINIIRESVAVSITHLRYNEYLDTY
jgi:hypothetical protein